MTGVALLAGSVSAAAGPTFLESGGRVVVEAEHFAASVPYVTGNGTTEWKPVPVTNAPTNGAANARGGDPDSYVQCLPDAGPGVGGPNNPPCVDYSVRISTTGTYRLWLRWDGFDGSSDSLYAGVVELADGPLGPADWYRFAGHDDRNFAIDPWHGSGEYEGTSAGGGDIAAQWNIASAGDYTVRISAREDGAMVDALILQLTSLGTPSGTGPAESEQAAGPDHGPIPEPAGLAVLLAGLVGMSRRKRT
ncbi:MAG: PEP-CTERM sorting domain-containing protein [Planctomycetota bacterium]